MKTLYGYDSPNMKINRAVYSGLAIRLSHKLQIYAWDKAKIDTWINEYLKENNLAITPNKKINSPESLASAITNLSM